MAIIQDYHLPYNSADNYIIAVSANADILNRLFSDFDDVNFVGTSLCVIDAGKKWGKKWQLVKEALRAHDSSSDIKFAVIEGNSYNIDDSSLSLINSSLTSFSKLDDIASNLWLGDAFLEDRLISYFQPVVDKRGKIFGYEALARVLDSDGTVPSGASIMAASKALKLEYRVDRYLHHKAVEAFSGSDVDGFLFINIQLDFIQRPEIYMEELLSAISKFGVVPQKIVLDITHSETRKNIAHLQSVCSYAQSQGYNVALDNISSTSIAKNIMKSIKPNFVKLDRTIVDKVCSSDDCDNGNGSSDIVNEAKVRADITDFVRYSHDMGVSIVALGIEDEDTQLALKDMGVDLFQGYHIGVPRRFDITDYSDAVANSS